MLADVRQCPPFFHNLRRLQTPGSGAKRKATFGTALGDKSSLKTYISPFKAALEVVYFAKTILLPVGTQRSGRAYEKGFSFETRRWPTRPANVRKRTFRYLEGLHDLRTSKGFINHSRNSTATDYISYCGKRRLRSIDFGSKLESVDQTWLSRYLHFTH